MPCRCDVVLVSVASPILVGVYSVSSVQDCADSMRITQESAKNRAADSALESATFDSAKSPNLESTHKKMLTQSMSLEGKTSDILPAIFQEILERYTIERVFYANGPGNFSAIRLTHVFLQTLSHIQNIKLLCADSFYFTKDRFIHAYGKIHFYKDGEVIKTMALNSRQNAVFALPNAIHAGMAKDFCESCSPLYVLPAL